MRPEWEKGLRGRLYALARRMLPLAGQRVLGVTALLALSAGGFWAAFMGSGGEAAFGVGLVSAISAFRVARGLPVFDENSENRGV